MPFTWKLSSKHDLSIVGGKLSIATSRDEIKQRVIVTLWHHWEEYFLNVPAGVPWYELILGSRDRAMVEAIIRQTILSVPGVLGVLRLQILSPTDVLREFTIYADIEVLGGSVSLQATSPREL